MFICTRNTSDFYRYYTAYQSDTGIFYEMLLPISSDSHEKYPRIALYSIDSADGSFTKSYHGDEACDFWVQLSELFPENYQMESIAALEKASRKEKR